MMLKKQHKKKIAYFSVNSFIGGAERATLNYCVAHIKNKKFDVVLITLVEGELTTLARNLGVEVIVLNQEVKFKKILTIIKAIYRLRRILVLNGVDIIHSSMAYAQVIASLACYNMDVKSIWYSHGPVDTVFDRFASFLHCDHLLYNSKYLKEKHLKIVKIFDVESHVIYPIVSIESNNNNISRNSEFLFLGRISRFKGIEKIIEAVYLLNLEGLAAKVNIAGKANSADDKEYEEELRKLISKYGLEERVVFIGEVSDTRHLLSEHSFLIHSSTCFEPFGMVIVEAMGNGCIPLFSKQSTVGDVCSMELQKQMYDSTAHNSHFELKFLMKDFFTRESEELNIISHENIEVYRKYFKEDLIVSDLERVYEEN